MQGNQRHMPKSFIQAIGPVLVLICLADVVIYVVSLIGG